MAEEDDASKTEEPSSRKLGKAREKGQVALSMEVKNWFILLGMAFSVAFLAPWVMDRIRMTAMPFIHQPHAIGMDFESLHSVFAEVAFSVFITLLPLFGMMMLLALIATLVQAGLIWAPSKIKFDIKKISPISGAKRLISIKQFVEFLKGIIKILIVGLIAFGLAVPMLDDIMLIPDIEFVITLQRLRKIALWLVIGTVLVMTAIGALDYLFQRRQFMKEMRMTKQEVKDEFKQTEGDPQVKARIRGLRMQRARQRMMAAVPDADVVVTNPTHFSVALKYKMEQMTAPKLVAKGVDDLARRIRDVAEEHDVPIIENPPLARALYASVELDEEVPPEHYKAVAEVIGYVMRLRGQLPSDPGQMQ